MMIRTLRHALVFLLLLGLTACDANEGLEDFENDAARLPEGITRVTGDECRVVEGAVDEDDWRSSPRYPTVEVGPACPNPVSVDYTFPITIPFLPRFGDEITGGVTLTAVRLVENRLVVGPVAALSPGDVGVRPLEFTLGHLAAAVNVADPRGLYRLLIRDEQGRLISYGDLLVE